MEKVQLTLKFLRPCLGGIRSPPVDRFERDPATGRVMFMNSWWLSVAEVGARALGKHQDKVRELMFDLYVHGSVSLFDRQYFDPERRVCASTRHEAFAEGATLSVSVVLPDGLPVRDFAEIMSLAGRFRGISPYGWKQGYGRFSDVKVCRQGGEVTHE